jgi:AcrR family transcriptional regulator
MKATDRRKQLLWASVECFAHYGYQGTTTARLAQAAQVSEPILYKHFGSKHDMFVALLDQVGKEVLRQWRKAIAPLKSPLDQLRVLLRMNPATVDPRTRPLYRVIFAAQAELNEPRIQAALRRHYVKYAQFITGILKKAQRAKQVRGDVSAEGLTWQLIHSAIGFALIKPLDIPGQASPAHVEQAIGLLMEELSADRQAR